MGVADLLLRVDEQDLAGNGVEDEAVGDRSANVAGADNGDAGGEITGRHCLLWWVSKAVGVWKEGCNNMLLFVSNYRIQVRHIHLRHEWALHAEVWTASADATGYVGAWDCGVCHNARNASASSRMLQSQ